MDQLSSLKSALSDRYRVERQIGVGGMATVYLAHDVRHNRKVAIKVMNPELVAFVSAERFLKEIETTARLQHPHILPLFDSGRVGQMVYYVMPYVEGQSLRARLSSDWSMFTSFIFSASAEASMANQLWPLSAPFATTERQQPLQAIDTPSAIDSVSYAVSISKRVTPPTIVSRTE